jgi:hypothetical protein
MHATRGSLCRGRNHVAYCLQPEPAGSEEYLMKMIGKRLPPSAIVLLALALGGAPRPAAAQDQHITSPEEFFGFRMGADRKMARWDRMVEYYQLLGKTSPKLEVVNMGPSTMGNPFLLVIISSPANLSRLEELRQVNAKISDPRGIPEAEIRKLVARGRAVIVQSMSLHATEIGGSQMAPELAYDLVTRTDDATQRILDNVIFLMVPSFNPDGEIMVTDWYRKTLGTEYEGVGYPSLYHKYAGHDNNRDAFQTNLVESQYMAKILFRDWKPQAYIDHHQMGSYGARIYVPPYADPVRPFADPLVWREMSWYGAHIAYKEEEDGLSGVLNVAQYSGWGHFGFHWITPFHNIAGMLTEAASARLATPLFIHPDQLRGGARGLPEYEEQTTFPDPWPGGWWRLRDIVERQKTSAWAALDLAARNRETVLWNAYLKARRQTERGAAGKPAAYVVPAAQHDPLTAAKLVNQLLVQGVEVLRSPQGFTHEGMVYGPGSFVVSMAQPKMGLIRWLLGRTFYPDNSFTRDNDGNPIRPYDMAADVMAEFMGVRVDPVDTPVEGNLVMLAVPLAPAGTVHRGPAGSVLDGRLNDAFHAVNLLLDKGVAVRRVDRPADPSLHPGDFLVTGGSDAVIADVAKQTGVDFTAFAGDATRGSHALKRLRVGMYQRYYGGNIDEGWTRLLLEQFGFPYTTLMDADIKAGKLEQKYDVIILPADNVAMITGDRAAGGGGRGGRGGRPTETYPPEYRSGIGQDGVAALRSFVQNGGTLLTFGEAGSLPIERFGLPLRNVVADLPSKEFWCPGSTLNVRVDDASPLGYGMPAEALAVFLANSQAYEILPTDRNDRVHTIVTFPERDLLRSGWLLGEQVIAKKAAMVAVDYEKGKVVLIGIRAQHRDQTHGTYKLVFNVLLSGPEESASSGT